MLINQHSLVLIMGSLQFFLTLRKLTIEKQTVVSTKRDLPQFVVGNVSKTRGQNGNQGQPKLIMQTCTSGLRPRHRFVRCLRSLWSTWPPNNRTNLYNFRFVLMLVCFSPQIFCHRLARSTQKLDFVFNQQFRFWSITRPIMSCHVSVHSSAFCLRYRARDPISVAFYDRVVLFSDFNHLFELLDQVLLPN